ncbi:MAG: hypothetical protein G01um101419_219 [Parcubacteria group bacterium Gr01-1014_19]|nr:MAG: hypothetical protein G01um101419_219 [Parcubacteria group bacterium Gr01-1014_19]
MTPVLLEKLRRNVRIHLTPHLEKHTRETLLAKITTFHKEHGRIPLKREFNMFKEYKKRFGSWDAAIAAAGFSTNPITFSYKFQADDGHRCDSFTEKIIDNWLSAHRIAHKRSYKYDGTKMTADFFIAPNIVVEFFGLAGVQKSYDAIIEKKRRLCRKSDLKLVEIYPADVFEKPRLAELLRFE